MKLEFTWLEETVVRSSGVAVGRIARRSDSNFLFTILEKLVSVSGRGVRAGCEQISGRVLTEITDFDNARMLFERQREPYSLVIVNGLFIGCEDHVLKIFK